MDVLAKTGSWTNTYHEALIILCRWRTNITFNASTKQKVWLVNDCEVQHTHAYAYIHKCLGTVVWKDGNLRSENYKGKPNKILETGFKTKKKKNK